jgi:hypothetical protein
MQAHSQVLAPDLNDRTVNTNDRIVREENLQLLSRRWFYALGSDPHGTLLNMTPPLISTLASMNEHAIRRAAACVSPLFTLSNQAIDVLEAFADGNRTVGGRGLMHSSVVAAHDQDNCDILYNRWLFARGDALEAQVSMAMTRREIAALRKLTRLDISTICSTGMLLARPRFTQKFLFHAGTFIGLSQAQRTTLLVQSAAAPSGRFM